MKTISIIMPVFNERETLLKVLEAVRGSKTAGLEKEIILVDDCSTDGTRGILKDLKIENLKIFLNQENEGKGFSIRRGFEEATGDYVIIQDADLEYDPNQYAELLEPLEEGECDVVYGSRFLNRPFEWRMYFLANKFLTLLSNLFTGLSLTDMETCYKCFTKAALQKINPNLKANRFDIEPEITAWVGKLNLKVKEVAISYNRRSYADGKKIGFKDGIQAIWTIIHL
jgi:glycosyltransferase involved in cell wall biosynthesis